MPQLTHETGIRDLYADRQSLVYNHHQELVNASETVGHMREGIEALGPSRQALEAQLLQIQKRRTMPPLPSLASQKSDSESGCDINWEKDVAPVAELPLTLRYMIDESKFNDAESLFQTYLPVLEAWEKAGVVGADELRKDCTYMLKDAQRVPT